MLNESDFAAFNNKTALSSSLNVSGRTTSNNTSNVNRPLNISGLNVVNVLNSFGTDITNLNHSVIEKQIIYISNKLDS